MKEDRFVIMGRTCLRWSTARAVGIGMRSMNSDMAAVSSSEMPGLPTRRALASFLKD